MLPLCYDELVNTNRVLSHECNKRDDFAVRLSMFLLNLLNLLHYDAFQSLRCPLPIGREDFVVSGRDFDSGGLAARAKLKVKP